MFGPLRLQFAALGLVCTGYMSAEARAEEIFADTFLVSLNAGSYRSSLAADLSKGGYELSDGTDVSLADWYTPLHPEITALFLRQITPDFGLLWGISSGERAEKYEIDPSLIVGFVAKYQLSRTTTVSLRATVPLGGDLDEYTCMADYGQIGGVREVNCRLAATELTPEDTLKYLLQVPGRHDARLTLTISTLF